ncbi:hypothetical protein, partial [uncultured Vibrio sp.]|uniref:hypothetical protein n=2 Tax=uncultured Vibrio sp. TaxID=114054 RepID=UPI002639E933
LASTSSPEAAATESMAQTADSVGQALAQQIAAFNLEPESVEPLPPLSEAVEDYLDKLSELNMATLDAQVREQHLRAQPDTLENELSLIGGPVSVTPVVSAPSIASKASASNDFMLGSLVQIDDGQWQARLRVHGRWHKVQEGTEVGTLSVVSVSEQGVRLRDNGTLRWLRMEGL